jgi:hypothetical protein
MPLVEKHPTDEGKFQSTFDSYGHGQGNGKSRNAVYKYAKKLGVSAKEKVLSHVTKSEKEPEKTGDSVQLNSENENELHKIGIEWGEVGWFEESEEPVKPNSIPKPVQELASEKVTKMNVIAEKSQRHLIRMGFNGLDRLITHWGRGVLMDKEWEIQRSKGDIDALEESSMAVMKHYGINVELNPVMVWGITVGSAYIPPIAHVQKNAHPSKRGKGIFSRIIASIKNRRRFRRRGVAQNQGEIDA